MKTSLNQNKFIHDDLGLSPFHISLAFTDKFCDLHKLFDFRFAIN